VQFLVAGSRSASKRLNAPEVYRQNGVAGGHIIAATCQRRSILMDESIRVPDEGLIPAGSEALIAPEQAEKLTHVLIPQESLADRISALAERICLDYRGAEQLTFLAVLEGARTFAEDLGQAVSKLDGPAVEFDYIKARTYGEEIKGEGETERKVSITVAPRRVQGKHILVVEDIVDQGFTLTRIRELLIDKKPASMKICALLLKRLGSPTAAVRELREDLHISYSGFDVPDLWVAGYGIDVGGELRDLPFVAAVNEAYYSESRAER
jgi:hypoxanthine phosphoribosyltransferase